MQRRVGIRQLKAEASALVDAAEAGESVIVTRRGREVARLVPVPDGDVEDASLRGAAGVSWSGRRPGLPVAVRVRGSGPSAAETVLDDREHRSG